MSDLPEQNTIQQYVQAGSETDFLFNFYAPTSSDINVYVTPANDAPSPTDDIQTLNTDYTVAFNADPITGGTITFLAGHIPSNGDYITISRDVQAELDVQFSNAQNFSGANLDTVLDKLLLLIQQNLTYNQDRSLSYLINSYFPTSESISLLTQIPVPDDGQIWKRQGDAIIATTLQEDPDSATLRSDLANATEGGDGARIVGFYDAVNLVQTTVQAVLSNLNTIVNEIQPYAENPLSRFPTGYVVMGIFNSTPAGGFIPMNDGTIGNASSGATTRANADTEDLFTILWNGVEDTYCPVSGGRGVSAAADFAANKTITLTRTLGRVLGIYGAGSGLTSRVVGEYLGTEEHVISEAQMPQHNHNTRAEVQGMNGGSTYASYVESSDSGGPEELTQDDRGSNDPIPLMQPTIFLMAYIKL